MSEANKVQIGGQHYKDGEHEEHWDRVHRLGLDYFQGQITKYVERCWLKNGVEDLRKAQHFLAKYIELAEATRRKGASQQALGELVASMARDSQAAFDKGREEGMRAGIDASHRVAIEFTKEGGTTERDEYTCRACRTKVYARINELPEHVCDGEQAGRAYVAQGIDHWLGDGRPDSLLARRAAASAPQGAQ